MDMVANAIKTLGANIKRARRKNGTSQEELANSIDTAQSLISQIEQGRISTSFGKVVEIARALDVGLPELIEGCYDGSKTGKSKTTATNVSLSKRKKK